MLLWLKANIGTLVVALVVLLIVTLIVVKMVKDRRAGQSSCGCGCENCAMRNACHQAK